MRTFLASLLSLLALSLYILPSPAALAADSNCLAFTRNLTVGQSGSDVQALQKFLNSRGFQVAATGPGSPGSESLFFGTKTKFALASFQLANQIAPAAGYLGPLSRAKIFLACSSSPSLNLGMGTGIPTTTASNSSSSLIAPSASPASTSSRSGIEPRSIVGILCTIRSGNQVHESKGSGVIVNQQGYVLTARHIVDPSWTLEAYGKTLTPEQRSMYQNAVLEKCTVGLPEEASLPDAQSIRAINPSTLITRNFQYEADLFYVPSPTGLSYLEQNTLDAAVLKITRPTFTCPYFNRNCNEIGRLPYSPIGEEMPRVGMEEVLSYGYPAEGGINDSGQSFYNFYLKGAVGQVGNYFNGDQRFATSTLNFSFRSSNIQGGRSGSPLFSKGKVIGILYGSTSTEESYNISITAILTSLKDVGYGWILATE